MTTKRILGPNRTALVLKLIAAAPRTKRELMLALDLRPSSEESVVGILRALHQNRLIYVHSWVHNEGERGGRLTARWAFQSDPVFPLPDAARNKEVAHLKNELRLARAELQARTA